MAKWTGRRIDDLFRRKVIVLSEAVFQVIVLAGKEHSGSVISEISDALAARVRDKLTEAPTTDAEWNDLLIIQGGTFGPDYDSDAAMAKTKSEYRTGVEALRKFFLSSAKED